MSTTISTAGVILKDVNGNVGKVNGLTDNDVATVNSAISAINKIAPSGSLPDATADTKGVVYAATKGVSVVQPESGKTYALTTESTDQLVTIANEQTITGSKTFSDVATFSSNVNTKGIYVRPSTDGSTNTPFYCVSYNTTTDTGTVANGIVYGDENTTINFGFSKEVTVPTVDTSTSSTKAASTKFVHNAIEADTTHASTTSANSFSGDQSVTGNVSVTGDVSATGTVTSGGSTVVTESTFDNQLTGKVLKTYPTSTDGRYIYASDDVPTALGIGKGSVDFAQATSVTVPDVYSTIPEPTTSNLEAASVSYVKQYVDNHASSGVSPIFVDQKGRDFSQFAANKASLDCSELIGTGATYATFDDLYTDVIAQNYDKIRVGQSILISNVSWSYGSASYTQLKLRVLDLRFPCLYRASTSVADTTSFGLLVALDPFAHTINSAAHSSTEMPSSAYVGLDIYTTALPAIYTALAGTSDAPLYGKLSATSQTVSTVWSSNLLSASNPNTKGAVENQTLATVNMFIPSEMQVFGRNHLATAPERTGSYMVHYDYQIAAFRNAIRLGRTDLIFYGYNSGMWLSTIASSTKLCCAQSATSFVAGANRGYGIYENAALLTSTSYNILPCFVIGKHYATS